MPGISSRLIRILSLSILACVCWASSSPAASSLPSFSNKFDDNIQSAVRQNWPEFNDWKYWKAQLYQESRFDPNAQSPVGAQGLAQFMPQTWADITKQLGWSGISANQAGPAIEAGAFYMGKLRRTWAPTRPMVERHYLGLASYNAGTGSIIKAQKACGNALLWAAIAPCLAQVTGPLASQTVDYVAKIRQWRVDLGL